MDLHALCPDSVEWVEGMRFEAGTARDAMEEWIQRIGIGFISGISRMVLWILKYPEKKLNTRSIPNWVQKFLSKAQCRIVFARNRPHASLCPALTCDYHFIVFLRKAAWNIFGKSYEYRARYNMYKSERLRAEQEGKKNIDGQICASCATRFLQ